MELQEQVEELKHSGIGVAAISYDPVETLAEFAEERGISYPLLSDEGSAVITEYGILNTVAFEGLGPDKDDPEVMADIRTYIGVAGFFDESVGTPFPGTFMLSADGIVEARHFEEMYRERNTTANVMLQLGIGLSSVRAIEGSTPELSFRAYPSNGTVVAGSRFAIAVDVEPKTDMHVYAPGAEEMGYRVVGLRLDDNPVIRLDTVEYPESEIYFFKPLEEYVPVYQVPFTLLQEVVVLAIPENQKKLAELDNLTITGSFNYQACDHKICYLPETVPLEFVLKIDGRD